MTRKFTILSALCCGLWLTSVAGAFQDEAGQPAAKSPDEKPAAKAQDRPNRPEGQQRGGPMRDPAQMVAMMMEKFDADGDQKLNAEELTAMLTFLRKRPGQLGMQGGRPGAMGGQRPGGQGPRPEGRPGAGRPDAKRPGSGADDQQDEAGGVKPRRPGAK